MQWIESKSRFSGSSPFKETLKSPLNGGQDLLKLRSPTRPLVCTWGKALTAPEKVAATKLMMGRRLTSIVNQDKDVKISSECEGERMNLEERHSNQDFLYIMKGGFKV